MNEYQFKQVDFDHPSFLFVLEDILKGFLGCHFIYDPYIRSFGLRGDEKILDFGCGGGTGSKCLLKFLDKNGHLTCVDTSDYWINRAKKRLSKFTNVELIAGDIRELPIPNHTFDIITLMHVLHDIEPAGRQSVVNSLAQKLKRDGSLFIREPIRISHGIAVNELKSLLKNADFWELNHEQNKTEYQGRYLKVTHSHDIIENKIKYYYPLRS
jgi:ubiquinone/menaquinone biosynthesis C-methylase UbiE